MTLTVNQRQPIETAPKDGTPVLGFGKIHYPGGAATHGVIIYDDPGEHVVEGGCYWYVQCDGYGHGDADCSGVTHWMPLPKGPSSI